MALALAMTLMQNEVPNDPSMVADIEAALREVIAQLPESSATFREKSDSRSAVLELLPSRTSSASISVIIPAYAEDRGVTLIAGKGSFFEIPRGGRRYTKLPLLGEMEAICSAVIDGRLEEWVVFEGSEVIAGRGVIELDQPITVRWRQFRFHPFRKKVRMHYQYSPWVAKRSE